MKHIELAEAGSSSTWLSEHLSELESMTLVSVVNQTSGRGQRGNSWEAGPGKNLTVSLLWKPEAFPAIVQFAASEAVALAVADTLADYGIEARVKWPNDIYVGDRKICGILIENSVCGRNIESAVCGIGLNVNQTEFLSDAPNPVSMLQLLGRETPLDEVLERLCGHLERRLAAVSDLSTHSALQDEYMSRLWRGDGKFHPFHDALADEDIEAAILAVAPIGTLTLLLPDATTRSYAFKEVSFIL